MTDAEALAWLTERPLDRLLAEAHAARMARWPAGEVTWLFDTNPNYTNVCVAACRFCAFRRSLGHAQAYTLTPAALVAQVAPAVAAGATTVLLQGGLHPEATLDYWLALLGALRQAYPRLHLHPFDPPEVVHLAKREGMTTRAVLAALWQAGVRTLPGGGAEVLVDRLRRRLSPGKCSRRQWLRVMAEAQRLGMRTTATLMYGHLETPADLVAHLRDLRALQAESGGFLSFIPWSFKPGHTPLGRQVPLAAHPLRYLRIIAVARLLLDNVPHIQSSWFSEGERVGQLGLLAGADDFGGVLFEERVLAETGHAPRAGVARVTRLIEEMGMVPVQRDTLFQPVNSTWR